MFQCSILLFSYVLTWTLPNGDFLQFAASSNIGEMTNSSDDMFTATLTNKTEDPTNIFRYLFTSTIIVFEPTNGSNLTCLGGNEDDHVEETTTITISGK